MQTINKEYKLGKVNSLRVLRLVSIGAYLEWDNGDEGILLPKRYIPQDTSVDDVLEVFVYHDNEGRLIATTMRPYAEVDTLAYLECLNVNKVGAFLNWGIHKDLLVPFSEQREEMREGFYYPVFLYIDKVSGKIVASNKLNKHIGNTLPEYKAGDEVEAKIVSLNDVGYRAVVDDKFWGIIYENECLDDLQRGDLCSAYVVRLRDDGKIDLSLKPIGYEKRIDPAQEKLMDLLRSNGGTLPIGDKSPAQEVMTMTRMSKKTFKMACGALYKAKLVELSPLSISLKQ